jgi:hypothetical protein
LALLVNKTQGWGFIHIPKTGGTSITEILQHQIGTEKITGHDSIRRFENSEKLFIFTFVRNPYTRILSAYFHGMRKGEYNCSFEEFLKKSNGKGLHMLPQTFYTGSGSNNKQTLSYIGKYENFEKDLKFIFKKLDIKYTKIPHLNYNPIYDKQPNLKQESYYKHFYTEEWMKDWVRERYNDDFKQFNYDLEI